MKHCFLLFLSIVSCSSVASQNTSTSKPLAIELLVGHELTGYNSSYEKHYFWEDGNFTVLDRGAHKTAIAARMSLQLNERNSLLAGVGYNYFQGRSNLEKVTNSYLDFEIGHRYFALATLGLDLYLDNYLNYENNSVLSNHRLKTGNLLWRTGLHIEKSIAQHVNLFVEANYSLGLLNSSVSDRYFLRARSAGINIGVQTQL